MASMTDTDTTTDTPTDTPTDNPAANDLARAVDTHLAAYCEPDPTRRAALVAQVWSPSGAVFDPPFEGEGHDGIAAMTDTVLTHFPGHTFRRTSAVDAHHTFARYTWDLVGPDGATAVGGTDVVEVDDDGRLVRIIGFFGDVPPINA
jgi:hypothetical protein